MNNLPYEFHGDNFLIFYVSLIFLGQVHAEQAGEISMRFSSESHQEQYYRWSVFRLI